jgi:hypothetical protein
LLLLEQEEEIAPLSTTATASEITSLLSGEFSATESSSAILELINAKKLVIYLSLFSVNGIIMIPNKVPILATGFPRLAI